MSNLLCWLGFHKWFPNYVWEKPGDPDWFCKNCSASKEDGQ